LTAWDTQSIKEQYAENFDAESKQKLAVFGAFSLYLNFINIFQLLLTFTGQREESPQSPSNGSFMTNHRNAGNMRFRTRKGGLEPGAPEGGPSCWRWPPLQLLRILEAVFSRFTVLK
jgi:hypothetical protein